MFSLLKWTLSLLTFNSIHFSIISLAKLPMSRGRCHCTTLYSRYYHPWSSVSLTNSSLLESWTDIRSCIAWAKRIFSSRLRPFGCGLEMRYTIVWCVACTASLVSNWHTLVIICCICDTFLGGFQTNIRPWFGALDMGHNSVHDSAHHSAREGRTDFGVRKLSVEGVSFTNVYSDSLWTKYTVAGKCELSHCLFRLANSSILKRYLDRWSLQWHFFHYTK